MLIREGVIASAEYVALIVCSLIAAALLVVINRSCGSHDLPRGMRMNWWRVLDVGFGILDLMLKVSFFAELRTNGPYGLVVATACVYCATFLLNAVVELRLLASQRREWKSAKHEADKLLGIADMRRRPIVWKMIIFLSILSPTIVVAWPWRARSFNGFPRMREAGLVMALVLLDDLPQILLVALSLSLSLDAGATVGTAAEASGTPASCDTAPLAAGISSTQLGSLAVAVISLLWRGVSRLVLMLLGENRTTSHILASRAQHRPPGYSLPHLRLSLSLCALDCRPDVVLLDAGRTSSESFLRLRPGACHESPHLVASAPTPPLATPPPSPCPPLTRPPHTPPAHTPPTASTPCS